MVDLRNSGDMHSPSSPEGRRIVVSHRLPLHAVPNSESPHGGFDFSLDTDALPYKHSRGLPGDVVFVGILPDAARSVSVSEELKAHLLERFSCTPVFQDEGLHKDFYHGFCMNYLCPLFHDDTLPLRCSSGGGGGTDFKADMYRAFITANTRFADCVSELLRSPDKDHVYIHDYHLLTLPSLLRHRFPSCRIYFTLHSGLRFSGVFCSSPIAKVLVCNLLNADLIAFVSSSWDSMNGLLMFMVHYNSSRVEGFLSTCSRLLNLSYKSIEGYTTIGYMDRTVVVKSVTCNSGEVYHLREMLSLPETTAIAREISTKYMGRKLVLDVEDDRRFYWNRCNNLQAMEKLLESQPELRGEVVLVKINNTQRHHVRAEVLETRDRINSCYGFPGYEPVVVINDPSMLELLAFYTLADVLIANESSMEKFIYYTVCGDDGPLVANAARAPCNGTMLAAGTRDDDGGTAMAGTMGSVLMMNDKDKQRMQEKENPYRYIISKYDTDYWTRSFEEDLETVRTYHESAPSFEKLSFSFLNYDNEESPQGFNPWFNSVMPTENQEYHWTGKSRSILQDYNDIVSRQGLKKATTMEVVRALQAMWSDPNNSTSSVSGRR